MSVESVPRRQPVVPEEAEAALRVVRRIGLVLLVGAVAIDVVAPYMKSARKRARTTWSQITEGVVPEEGRILDLALALLDVSGS